MNRKIINHTGHIILCMTIQVKQKKNRQSGTKRLHCFTILSKLVFYIIINSLLKKLAFSGNLCVRKLEIEENGIQLN